MNMLDFGALMPLFVWVFLGLGVMAHFARRDALADLFWWASIWAVTDDTVILVCWGGMVTLRIMARDEFPQLWRSRSGAPFARLVFKVPFLAMGAVFKKGGYDTLKEINILDYNRWFPDLNEVEKKAYISDALGLRVQRIAFTALSSLFLVSIAALVLLRLGEFDFLTVAFPALASLAVLRGAVRSNWENWQEFKAMRQGVSTSNDAERASLVPIIEGYPVARPGALYLHMALLFLAGGWGEVAAQVGLALVLVFSGFQKPRYSEFTTIFNRELWIRDLGFVLESKSKRNFNQKFDVLLPVALALTTGLPVLFLVPILIKISKEYKAILAKRFDQDRHNRDQRVELPQVVCSAAGLGFEWNWLDERELANKADKMRWAWLYHICYLDERGPISDSEILSQSDGALIAVGSRWTHANERRQFESIAAYVEMPFRHLAVLNVQGEFESGREFSELVYFCRVVDEPIFVQAETPLGDLIELEPIALNMRFKRWLGELEFEGLEDLYAGGVMELNILHRRVHEFSQPASRFLEILNIWELVARWALVAKQDAQVEGEEERLSIPFGVVFDLVRMEPIMKDKLDLPTGLIDTIRKNWKELFNWSASMSSRPTVEEAFTWMIYIRNKTKGHGSTSRIHFKLYATVELLTLLLFQRVKERMSLELLVFDEDAPGGVGTMRRGMRISFLTPEDENLEGLVLRTGDVYFRPVGSNGAWQTSKLLKAIKGNVFIMNDMKKGRREWICFSTGEMIRPEVIFDRADEV